MSTSATSGVAGRYASALFELADNAKSLDQVAEDLRTFRTMAAESHELARLLASPVIGRAAKSQALLAVLDAAGIKGLTRLSPRSGLTVGVTYDTPSIFTPAK